jgi:hypothetical protein
LSEHHMTARSGPRRYAVDAAMLQLVRLVLDDGWTAATAAALLRERVRDEAVLRRARAKVSRVLAERAGTVAERAAATLDLALSPGQPQRVDVPTLATARRAGR